MLISAFGDKKGKPGEIPARSRHCERLDLRRARRVVR